ncbi:MAG: hypothetical protein LBV67_09505 [Streptococcaceae bacterium]|jgi:hypothetical protein|nr:hypothetical protein [Streptococcaceae bacterium]
MKKTKNKHDYELHIKIRKVENDVITLENGVKVGVLYTNQKTLVVEHPFYSRRLYSRKDKQIVFSAGENEDFNSFEFRDLIVRRVMNMNRSEHYFYQSLTEIIRVAFYFDEVIDILLSRFNDFKTMKFIQMELIKQALEVESQIEKELVEIQEVLAGAEYDIERGVYGKKAMYALSA